MKNQLAKLDLLILDELGYVPASKTGSRTAVRRDQHRLRADQPDRNDQPLHWTVMMRWGSVSLQLTMSTISSAIDSEVMP